MSSSPSEPENAAPTASVMHEQGQEISPAGVQNKPSRWNQTSRTNSASLLTQGLAAERRATPANTSLNSREASASPQQAQTSKFSDHQLSDELDGVKETRNLQGAMALVASVASDNLGSLNDTGSTSTPPTELNDTSQFGTIFLRQRDPLNNGRGRGRGTSLERTEKEKRVQDSPKGTYSTNPGDTALPPSPAPETPAVIDPISSNQPTEGVRATYRQWRDSRQGIASEKAWSIGEDETDDILGGQVEKSIKDAMAGIEPNNRSRKSSHSLRFFKEGLPEDKTKNREGKSRGRSKDGSTRVKSSPLSEKPRQWTYEEMLDGQSPVTSPRDSGPPTSIVPLTQLAQDTNVNTVPGNEDYFDSQHNVEAALDERLKTMPSALLDEIRKHHNLTPGATKGSSFSRSIPVTESERQKPETDDQSSRSEDNFQQVQESNLEGGKVPRLSRVKSPDEEDESGEEQISSALFVPHKTPHESPERKHDTSQKSVARPRLNDPNRADISTSQEWLEEYEVPSHNLEKKYISQEPKKLPLPSPTYTRQLSPRFQKEGFSNEPEPLSDVDTGAISEDGYTVSGRESSVADDEEITPTSSLKQDAVSCPTHHVHAHQQISRQPLEAIELIPYRHQVGGHTTLWRFSKRAVCKQLNNRENEFYEKIERYHPLLLKFLPKYVYSRHHLILLHFRC
jgi:inositol-hexakisphosphate kinase